MTIKELAEELKLVIKGNTLDAILPPMIYLIGNLLFSLELAAGLSISAAFLLAIFRRIKKQSWYYALGGLLGIIVAVSFALFAGSASNYYVPKLITSTGLVIITTVSLVFKKPLAAWLSHISRGWELNWFWRNDIRPAYSEVTTLWLVLFVLRGVLQLILIQDQNLSGLFIINTLLGMPLTVLVLLLSYIYGIWRLKKLGGPGIEEYRENAPKPWKGQTRGF